MPGTVSPLERWRREKDAFLADHPGSPLYGHPAFAGLAYFPEDPAARVVADVERPTERTLVRLVTSSGDERAYVVYGTARFELGGEPLSLTLFAPLERPGGPELFVPFKDATSGRETYGAGRYLEARADPAAPAGAPEEVVLDFNYAYHPYCAYAEGYSCPFPPPGNRLGVPVRAGERLAEEGP